MPVASPFYLAYVADDTVAFNPVTHAVMDEYVFSWRRILSETDKPVLELEMRNPHIGVLNTSRQQWAWLSWLNPNSDAVEPILRGRIVGNPNNAFAEIITVSFVSWPTNYFARQQAVAETLKVPPFWDLVFVPVEKSDDPNTILESRSEMWCVDPITLAVTAEDILDASDGNVDITNHFYDSLDMHDGDAPLTAVLIDATVSWTQTGRGFIDMGQQVIESYGGDGIISEWPKPLEQLGVGWSVQSSYAFDLNYVAAATVHEYTYSWNNPEKEHSDGDSLSLSISISGPTGPGVSHTLTSYSQGGVLDPFATDSDGDPSPLNIPAKAGTTSTTALLWKVQTSLILRYDLARQRTERVRIMLNADLQPVVNDPLVTQNSETIVMTGRDVGVPIVNLLDSTTVRNTDVVVGQVIFPDDPQLPGGRSAQICVVAGHTATVDPEFSDIPGDITVDGTAHWSSLGTQNPTEGAQDWTAFTNYAPGAIILPRLPLWTTWIDAVRANLLLFPAVGTQIGLGQIVQGSNGFFFQCTLDGTTGFSIPAWPATYGATVVDGNVTWTCIGDVLPDGKTYYITANGGLSGALYVTPPFGAGTALHAQTNDNGITWISIGSGDIPAGGTPGNVWARSYFDTDRGTQSLEYLMAIGRAHIRKRARAVELEFEIPFEEGIGITCRKTVTLHDTRIPGGVATGKVTRAELSANGDTGEVKCRVTIGCPVGKGNTVTAVPGTSTYTSASGYMQSSYQQAVGGVTVLPTSDIGYTPLVAAPNDDGLVLPLDKAQVVLSETIKGSLAAQLGGLGTLFASMSGVAQLNQAVIGSISQSQSMETGLLFGLPPIGSLALQLQYNPIYYELQLKPVVNGPFWDTYRVLTQLMTLPQGIDLAGASTP
jgi:hypothetical protein